MKKLKSFKLKTLIAGLLFFSVIGTSPASAIQMLNNLGPAGDPGFGDLVMGRNDDGSSNLLDSPFDMNLFGTTHTQFHVNNNGNITFNGPLSGYTPVPFPVTGQPMIAPFWGDVDTRCGSCGEVYLASPNEDTVVVTWDSVGFYSSNSSRTNSFQLVLRDRDETGAGNFDIEFRFEDLNWTTGNASGGSGGLGGTPAQSGFDAGDNENFFSLPGSRTAAVLELQNTSNVGDDTPGLWSFAIRNGILPGSTSDNPLMPVITDEGWDFEFNIGDINDVIFIDPVVAIGYDYIVDSGPNFQTVLLPTGIGDNSFDLWLHDGSDYVDSGIDLSGGVAYNFGAGGVDRFRILGIEVGAGLDPGDTSAFVTGLTFAGVGNVSMSQNPISFDTDAGTVPEPGTWALLFVGLLGFVFRAHRLNKVELAA